MHALNTLHYILLFYDYQAILECQKGEATHSQLFSLKTDTCTAPVGPWSFPPWVVDGALN